MKIDINRCLFISIPLMIVTILPIITSGQNVGIGINTPLAPLHIKNDNEALRIEGTTPYISFHDNAGTRKGFLQSYNNDLFLGTPSTNTNGIMQFYLTNSPKMTILPNGNVGIGTNNPLEKLTIQTLNNSYGISHLGEGGNILATRMGGTSAGIGTFSATNMRIFSNGLSRIFIAEATGNVGIGIADDNPVYKLDIGDRIRIRSGTGSAGVWFNNPTNSAAISFMGVKDVDLAGMWGNVSGWGLLMNTNTGAVSVGSQNPVAGYKLSVHGNEYVGGALLTTGNAEIGANAEIGGNAQVNGSLKVYGTATSDGICYAYFNVNSNCTGTSTGSFSGFPNYSIYSTGNVLAYGFLSFSDSRIKDIVAISNSTKDLETINALQITDYTMKDKAMYGNKAFKKVIAQEVEKVYPQVVSANVGYIPNVYAVPSKIEKTTNGFMGSLLSFTNKHNLSNGAKKIQLMIGREIKEFDIVDVPSENQVVINATDLKTDKVFVYGEQINDFRNVDYDGLVTLNISATQELSKLIKKQQQQIDLLLKRIEALEKK